MGAQLTAKLLTLYPERFVTATLGGAGGRIRGAEGDRFIEEQATALEQGKGIEPVIRRVRGPDQPPLTDDQIQEISRRALADNDVLALAAVIRGTKAWQVEAAQMRANRIPTLALIGSRDALWTDVQTLQTWMPSLEVAVIEGATHADAPRRPEFREYLLTFLQAHKDQGQERE